MLDTSKPKVLRQMLDGSFQLTDSIWCDICGYGCWHEDMDPVTQFHFCHRHKPSDINDFLSGKTRGYFSEETQLDLFPQYPIFRKTDKKCHINGFRGLAVLVTPPLSLTHETFYAT